MNDEPSADDVARRHVRFGFAAFAVFAALGLVLEGAHAFKVPAYLDVGREAARLCLRLGHAHGALLALVNVVYGAVLRTSPSSVSRTASRALVLATVLLPTGFVLGGLFARSADPGLPIVLVPAGALSLILFAITAARRA